MPGIPKRANAGPFRTWCNCPTVEVLVGVAERSLCRVERLLRVRNRLVVSSGLSGSQTRFSFENRCYCGYSTGEIAGFEPEIAALLVKRGVAVPVEPADEAA